MAGAVAAVVLVVVFLHPFATSGPVLGLSTVTWAPDHALDLMGERGPGPKSIAPKKRLAIMLYFEDVKPKPGAQEIDALYRLLDPGRVVRRRYEVVSPSQVKEAVEREGMTQGGKQEILHLLHTKLGVQSALIMALSQRRDRFTIRASLTDTETGKVTNERKIPDVKRANLSQEVEAAAESVLKSK